MVNTDAYREELVELANSYDITITNIQAELILTHLDLVIEKNRLLNLTAIKDEHNALIRHALDSLLFIRGDESGLRGSCILDIGTGAGFPGIPLAVATESHVDMIDSVGKKVNAVNEFIDTLGLRECKAYSVRAEEYAKQHLGEYEHVVARAVSKLGVLIEYATPLLTYGGTFIASKGRIEDDEIRVAEQAAKVCGMQIVSRETFELPNEEGHREIFVIRRVAEPKFRLPRRVGLAGSKPLGVD